MFKYKQDIHFRVIRGLILLVLLFVHNEALPRVVVAANYNGGFERVTGLQNTGQSYYLLSKELTELGFSLAYNSGRITTYVEHKIKTVKYESGTSVNLNEEDFIENTESKIGFSTVSLHCLKWLLAKEHKHLLQTLMASI